MTQSAVEEIAEKYIKNSEHVLKDMKMAQDYMYPDKEKVREVIEEAKRYLDDAKYYLEEKRFETSLASVAYCEGLLDALRMLGFVRFMWRVNTGN